MSLTTVAEVRALVDTDLEDADLQAVIDREEAWLARRVGPLSGPRTVTIPSPRFDADLVLMRPTAAATVTNAGQPVTVDLIGGTLLRRLSGWLGPVAVTYTPDDELEVKRAVIYLIQISLKSVEDLAGEQIGSYSYQRFGAAGAAGSGMPTRAAIIRSLLPKAYPTSVVLR